MLIDCHSHLRLENSRSKWIWFEGEPEGPLPLERFIAHLKREPISHAILSYDPSSLTTPEKLRDANDAVHRAVELGDGFISGLCQVNPHLLDESLGEVDRHVANGALVGIGEICQYLLDFKTDSPTMYPIVEKAVEIDATLLVHASSKEHTDGVARLAERFEEARFVMAHMGGMYNWPEGLRVAASHENVWMDTSGFVMLRPGAMRRALEEVGARKLLFGVDYPLVKAGALLAALEELDLPTEERNRIAFANAAELFGLDSRTGSDAP